MSTAPFDFDFRTIAIDLMKGEAERLRGTPPIPTPIDPECNAEEIAAWLDLQAAKLAHGGNYNLATDLTIASRKLRELDDRLELIRAQNGVTQP